METTCGPGAAVCQALAERATPTEGTGLHTQRSPQIVPLAARLMTVKTQYRAECLPFHIRKPVP